MADAHKTSVAGSLATTFSEKLKVTSAKLGGDQKELNVAIIKATTSQFHVVPKEKHVQTLKLAVHPSRPRRDVTHIITELHRRLLEATDWLTALKTLITLHRLMRESEPAFVEELVRYNAGLAQSHVQAAGSPVALAAPARLFCTDNFIDKTSSEGRFDFSEWVRAYGKYLEEQLSVYAQLRWYVGQEAPGQESRMRGLGPRDLLLQLPHLQRLQRRLLDCTPHGAAMHDPVVLFSLSLVVKESFKLYKAVSESVINLADAFFEMDYHDAVRGLEFYKESMSSGEALSNYYAAIEQIEEIKRTMQLPKLSTMPPDFLASMEAYVAEAPRQLPAAGEAPAPAATKRAPLRKGKLLQAAPGAKRTGSGASAAAAVAAAAAAPRDPGMVLPLPSGTALVASDSADSGGAGAAPASSASGPSAQPDLLGDAAVESREAGSAASEAAAPPKPAPSPLDLLSDLDFSWAPSAGAAPAPAAPASTNPFADLPAAPTAAPAAPAQQQPATGSSNPFGEPSPASAAPSASGFGGPAGLEWPAAALPAAPPQLQQPSWPMQQAQQQPAYGAYGGGYGGGYGAPLPSPAGGAAPHLAVSSDDPFAGFGAPSPAAAAAPRPAAGGYWGAPSPGAAAAPYGAVPSPPRPIGDELSKAALNDPFASLTGLPQKSSPGGSAGAKPSPPRTAGAYSTAGFF